MPAGYGRNSDRVRPSVVENILSHRTYLISSHIATIAPMTSVDHQLETLGIQLPAPREPAFSYNAVVVDHGIAWVSGQLPWAGGKTELVHTGRLGKAVSLSEGQACARACILNALAALKSVGDNGLRRARHRRVTPGRSDICKASQCTAAAPCGRACGSWCHRGSLSSSTAAGACMMRHRRTIRSIITTHTFAHERTTESIITTHIVRRP